MVTKKFCDRCQRELSFQDEQIFYGPDNARWYEGKDICQDCILEVEIVKNAAVNGAMNRISIEAALKRWLKIYE